jgi:membrane associated rhomboid family serine protease
VFPAARQHPTERFPVVTVAIIVSERDRVLLLAEGGITLGDPSSPHYLQNLSDYGRDPVRADASGQALRAGVERAAAVRGRVRGDRSGGVAAATWITPFTAMFMHGGLLHLGGNMLFLWIFGNNVEDAMGPVKFVLFYLLSGLAALAGQVIVGPDAMVPTLGASGAIAGVLGGYLILFPGARS